MNLYTKFISIVIMPILALDSQQAMALEIIEKRVGQSIVGYMPYFNSIGSEVIESSNTIDVDDKTIKTIGVGAKIQVPSHLYQFKNLSPVPFFDLAEKDVDVGSAKGNKIITNIPMQPNKYTSIRWFIIEAKEGFKFSDETDKEGQVITHWDDTSIKIVKEITEEQYVDYTLDNQNSKVLIVPEASIGYRIGFWLLPETENGLPDSGKIVKVFDLGKFFSQPEVFEPGPLNPLPDEACIERLCGTPSGDNPNGGGGVVPGDEWIVNIYDEATNKIIDSTSEIEVNKTYFATIRIRDKNNMSDLSEAYRDPTPVELLTLNWYIYDLATGKTLATYTQKDTDNRVNNDAGTVEIGGEVFKKYSFKTQTVNSDAAPFLQTLAPNYSEQGFGLGIQLEINK